LSGKHCIYDLWRSRKEQIRTAILDFGDLNLNLNLKAVTPKNFHFAAKDYTLSG